MFFLGDLKKFGVSSTLYKGGYTLHLFRVHFIFILIFKESAFVSREKSVVALRIYARVREREKEQEKRILFHPQRGD